MKNIKLTEASSKLLESLAHDAIDWDGYPLLDINKNERGNLTDLKHKGLLITFIEEDVTWVKFTDNGLRFIKDKFGIVVEYSW